MTETTSGSDAGVRTAAELEAWIDREVDITGVQRHRPRLERECTMRVAPEQQAPS